MKSDRSKDEFLATMSHELRTPLNAILGMAESLSEEIFGSLNEEQREAVAEINSSGHYLLALINDMLDMSKLEAGQLEVQTSPVRVEDVCQASLRLIEPDVRQKSLKLVSTIDRAASFVLADERRLKQILVNLLSNAIKFTPAGGQIGLEVRGDLARRVIRFTVWDTGIGIARENLPQLFHFFVQLDSRLSRRYSGTGLGLALAYRLARLQGGTVTVESRVGQGSRFTLSLPWLLELERTPL